MNATWPSHYALPLFDYSNIVWRKFLEIGDKRPVA